MILVDTGVIFAAADIDDPHHQNCADLLDSLASTPLGVTVPVIVESSWLIESRLGPAAEAVLHSLAIEDVERLDMSHADWTRVAELVEIYADLGLGIVDVKPPIPMHISVKLSPCHR